MGAARKTAAGEAARDIRQRFFTGQFPVATIDGLTGGLMEIPGGRRIEEVLGLVVSRGYSSEETFFGMLLRAEAKGAQGIIGYRESVSFHPDGSRFYTCYGTAVRFDCRSR